MAYFLLDILRLGTREGDGGADSAGVGALDDIPLSLPQMLMCDRILHWAAIIDVHSYVKGRTSPPPPPTFPKFPGHSADTHHAYLPRNQESPEECTGHGLQSATPPACSWTPCTNISTPPSLSQFLRQAFAGHMKIFLLS